METFALSNLSTCLTLAGDSGKILSTVRHVSLLWGALVAEMRSWLHVYVDNNGGRCLINVPSVYAHPETVKVCVSVGSWSQLQRLRAYVCYIVDQLAFLWCHAGS